MRDAIARFGARGCALALFAAGAALLPASAPAQLVSSNAPIVVESDNLEVRNQEGLVIYEGRVDAAQDNIQIRTDRLEVYFEHAGDEGTGLTDMGEPVRVLAIGGVYYVTPDQTAKGDRADYDLVADTVTLTGNVVVQQACDVLQGASMVMNLTTGDTQVRSAAGALVEAGGEGSSPSGRVRTVIYSDQDAAAEGDCAR